MPTRFLNELPGSISCPFCWDEWSFYNDVSATLEVADKLHAEITKRIEINTVDYVIGLSKSGLPLASLMALKLNKPLLPFSIGELFGSTGETIIGFSDEIRQQIKGSSVLVFDSHVRSGETFRLYQKTINSLRISTLAFCVIADCSMPVEPFSKCPLLFIYDSEKIHKMLSEKEAQIQLAKFWKNEPKHWLIPPEYLDVKPNENSSTASRLKELNPDLTREAANHLISEKNGKKIFTPLELYLNNDLFSHVVDEAVNYANAQSIDTIVACSFLAIPMAIAISAKIDTPGKIRFIFLGNGGVDYYRKKFVDSSNIMFCDDVLATGGLAYKAYKNFIEHESTNTKYLKIIVVLFFQHQFPFKDFTSLLPDSVSIYSLLQ